MADTANIDLMIKFIKEKGWFSIASIYFDNDSICNVLTTLGYVALSEQAETVFWLNIWDSTNTDNINTRYIHTDPRMFGHQKILLCQNLGSLQRFECALFSRADFYWDEQEKFPMPTIPKYSDLDALTKDEETGLYPDTPTVVYQRIRDKKDSKHPNGISVLPIYKDEQFKDKRESYTRKFMSTNRPYWDYGSYPEGVSATIFGVGADIDEWKKFEKNQKKFVAALKEYTGISDIM